MALVGLTLPVAACSSFDSLNSLNPMTWFNGEKYETKVIPDTPPEMLYDEGLAYLNGHDYDKATKKFQDLEKEYTFSQWERKALVMETFSQYQNGSFDDAIGTAQRYIGRYASAPDLDYVYYLEAMSYYNQIPDVSRDQDRARESRRRLLPDRRQIPEVPICGRCALQIAGHARSARRPGDDGWPLLS